TLPSAADQYREAFFPLAAKRVKELRSSGSRFVHYTTADTATHILRTNEAWLRNTSTLNDFSEVEHGLECLQTALASESGNKFRDALRESAPGVADEVQELFEACLPAIRERTFVTCFSEHNPKEDRYGRLSMWRAYGGNSGVALVLNCDVFFA